MKKCKIKPSCVNCEHYKDLDEVIDLFCNVKNKSSLVLKLKAKFCRNYKNEIFRNGK